MVSPLCTGSRRAARWIIGTNRRWRCARTRSSRSVSAPARFVIVAATLGSLLLSALPAAAQPPGVDHRRGQAALDRLGARLPAVAAQHNMAPARLRELFLADPYLAVDEADNLLFIDEFTPDEAAGAAGTAEATALALQPLVDTFLLHSLPGASKVIYLDFDGHTTTGTAWNNGYGATIVSAPYTIDGDSRRSATPNSSASSTSGSASPRTSSRSTST